jgi:serine protease Do
MKNIKKRTIILLSLLVILSLPVPSGTVIIPETFSGIVKLRAKSVVNISTTQIIKERAPLFPFAPDSPMFDQERTLKRQSLGSGFIIDENGYILTNNHVIENATDIRIRLWDETEYAATVVGKDRKTDIALIKIDSDRPLPVAPLGDSDALETGDWVIVIGNPFGLGHTVTAGIVSAKGRVIGAGPYDDFIQTDAAINPGNSGGPLFNTAGEVVGISTAIFTPSGGNIGIGFAIPVNLVREIISLLKEKGKVERGWLGVTVQKVTPEISESFGLYEAYGALVTDIAPDSPAEEAGLMRGDIIIEYNGKKIEDMHELPRLVALTPAGSTVSIKVFRDGGEIELSVTIKKLKEEVVPPEEIIEKTLGIRVKTLHPAIAEQFGISDGGAVIVSEVAQDSIAAKKNINKGDIILEVNRKRVKSIEELASGIKETEKGKTILLLIKRSTGYLYISIKMEQQGG